jgi:hypothetical protein
LNELAEQSLSDSRVALSQLPSAAYPQDDDLDPIAEALAGLAGALQWGGAQGGPFAGVMPGTGAGAGETQFRPP